MQVKELKQKLQNFCDNAEVRVCYESNQNYHYGLIETLEENQVLQNGKLTTQSDIVLMWLK